MSKNALRFLSREEKNKKERGVLREPVLGREELRFVALGDGGEGPGLLRATRRADRVRGAGDEADERVEEDEEDGGDVAVHGQAGERETRARHGHVGEVVPHVRGVRGLAIVRRVPHPHRERLRARDGGKKVFSRRARSLFPVEGDKTITSRLEPRLESPLANQASLEQSRGLFKLSASSSFRRLPAREKTYALQRVDSSYLENTSHSAYLPPRA